MVFGFHYVHWRNTLHFYKKVSSLDLGSHLVKLVLFPSPYNIPSSDCFLEAWWSIYKH